MPQKELHLDNQEIATFLSKLNGKKVDQFMMFAVTMGIEGDEMVADCCGALDATKLSDAALGDMVGLFVAGSSEWIKHLIEKSKEAGMDINEFSKGLAEGANIDLTKVGHLQSIFMSNQRNPKEGK